MERLVTILGGGGFVGRYVARRMAQAGWRVRVASRRPNEHLYVRTYGVPGQVEPVACNIRDDESLRAVIKGAEAVVNCVGILVETGPNRFAAVQAEGAERAARIAREEGVVRFVHISAIGADDASESLYARTKAAGERAVLRHYPDAVILRPSIIFGPEDQFFNRFAGMAVISPLLPIVGAKTRFQPVWVDDVAQAAARAAMGEVPGGIYELGGPEVATFRDLMARMLAEIRRRRLVVSLPFWAARILATILDGLQVISAGLFTNHVLTRDQVKNLARDNVISPGAKSFADLGITPTAMDVILPLYLWRFRPGGQFAEKRESIQNVQGDRTP